MRDLRYQLWGRWEMILLEDSIAYKRCACPRTTLTKLQQFWEMKPTKDDYVAFLCSNIAIWNHGYGIHAWIVCVNRKVHPIIVKGPCLVCGKYIYGMIEEEESILNRNNNSWILMNWREIYHIFNMILFLIIINLGILLFGLVYFRERLVSRR